MTEKRKEEPKEPQTVESANVRADIDQLVDKLLKEKDEQFEQTFLTENDNNLINSLPKEQREPAREALLKKGALFRRLHEKLLRVSADYANFQKRVPKQISDTIFYEKEMIIKSLLPVLDNFEHTLKNAQSTKNMEDFVKGVRIIYDQMLNILQSHGIEQIQALGEKFDPSLHEAMLQKAEPKQEDNLVLEEFQKGYKLNGRVIRPSRVIVNKLSAEQPTEHIEKEQTDIDDETIDTQ
jgi:molecular chaperone GrpE